VLYKQPQIRLDGAKMKIALIGSHGVGKTTLAYEICSFLKRSGKNVELVTEVARRSPFPVNEATTLEGQLWILHAQIAAELEAAQRAPYVVCDRAVIDNYCYLVNKCGRQENLESWLERWLATYDLLVGVPILDTEIPPDGFRSEDRQFQHRIHNLLLELLHQAPFTPVSTRVFWLASRSRTDWIEKIVIALGPQAMAAASV
jgi:nicotinamide riboside kinase